MSQPTLLPLFDTMENLLQSSKLQRDDIVFPDDFHNALDFIYSYRGSQGTFNSYRREVERFLHWAWKVETISIKHITRHDIEKYIEFCQNPPKSWISLYKTPRFVEKNGLRYPNQMWRPFVVTVSKSARKQGLSPNIEKFELSKASLRETFAILSTFYQFLIQEEYVLTNPVMLIRQKSKYIQKNQDSKVIRRLSETQWKYVLDATLTMATEDPSRHERTLFIMNALYAMYLRISELVASDRWTPQMNDFQRDHNGLWWFTTVGKGNKQRKIAVSDAMLNALKRYRKYLNLTELPTLSDDIPLLQKQRGHGPIRDTSYLRQLVQQCFDLAIYKLIQDGFQEDAEQLQQATVHWLRHTGISEDVKTRPREHVRDDAGHSSSAITDRYIDIEMTARHASAKRKKVDPDE